MSDILNVLNSIGYTNLVDSGTVYRTRPLYRDSDNKTSLVIKKDTGQFYDFSSRFGGNLQLLVQLTLNLKTLEEAQKVLEEKNFSVKTLKKDRTLITMPKKFDKEMLSKLIKDHSYWIKRGVSKDTVEQFQGGITFNGRMTNRYVFPIINTKDELVGFAGRILENNPNYPKWRLHGTKSQWCYPLKWNMDILVKGHTVILLESIGDMLALWECGIKNSLVLFGVDLSDKIIELLLKIDAHKIIIALNNDSENNKVGNDAADDMLNQLTRYFDNNQVSIRLPAKKDFGDMTKEEILQWHSQI